MGTYTEREKREGGGNAIMRTKAVKTIQGSPHLTSEDPLGGKLIPHIVAMHSILSPGLDVAGVEPR